MVSKKQKDDIKREQNWECDFCHKSIKSGGHIHHRNHDNTDNRLSNLQAICAVCHRKVTPTRKPKPKRFLTK
jgi:5-methylcytosine-specific restriction endonuclease McrA